MKIERGNGGLHIVSGFGGPEQLAERTGTVVKQDPTVRLLDEFFAWASNDQWHMLQHAIYVRYKPETRGKLKFYDLPHAELDVLIGELCPEFWAEQAAKGLERMVRA